MSVTLKAEDFDGTTLKKDPAGTASSDSQKRAVLVRNFIPIPTIDGVSDARKLL